MNTAVAKLPASSPAFRGAIVGMSGSGKGNCAKAFLAQEQKRGARILVFDPDDEYSVKGRASGQVHLGTLTTRVTADELLLDPARFLDGKKLALAVVPSDDDDEAAQQCADLVEVVMATGDMLVCFDELGGYAFGNARAAVAQKALNKLATKGRKFLLPALFVSQRMVHIPTSARAQVNALEIFAQNAPADCAALEELTGNKKLAEQVQSQPAGASLLWLSPMLKESKQ